MRPDISYYNKAGEEVEDMDVEGDEDGENESEKAKVKAKVKAKDRKKELTEVRVEYSKRRTNENRFGPLSYNEITEARKEEPWVVGWKCVFDLPLDEGSMRSGAWINLWQA